MFIFGAPISGSQLFLTSDFVCLSLGETGIGKSTLMDTLFNTNFENFESSHFEPQVKLRAQTYDLQESNVRLRLTVVNTVGFGDQMNKQERWEVKTEYECVLECEEGWQSKMINRKKMWPILTVKIFSFKFMAIVNLAVLTVHSSSISDHLYLSVL